MSAWPDPRDDLGCFITTALGASFIKYMDLFMKVLVPSMNNVADVQVSSVTAYCTEDDDACLGLSGWNRTSG